jgi:hypothetical protein
MTAPGEDGAEQRTVTGPGTPPADDTRELSTLLDEHALDVAVRARRAAREGRDRARELATWIGALRDLAEERASVQVRTVTESTVTGALLGVAADHVVLRVAGGGLTVVAGAAITGVRVQDRAGAVPASGDRPAPSGRHLLEVLDRWREDAAPVLLVTRGGDSERGRLVTVGEDLVSLATAAGPLHVPEDAIVAVTVQGYPAGG